MPLTQEQVTVEKVTQYGFRANGANYGLSPKLKEKNITPDQFKEGQTYLCEIWIGPKGGKSVNSFVAVGTSVSTAQTVVIAPPPPPSIPSIPPTSVSATLPPGGVAPVSPAKPEAQRRAEAAVVESDKMTKADWANKDKSIGIDAVIKSSLEAPALAQMVVGKSEQDAFELTRRFIKYNLITQELAKAGTL